MKSDDMTKEMIEQILSDGCLDVNPRPHYSDGTPAHTISINHVMQTYDLSKGELPIITLRPIAYKSSIKELLWIYQDQTSNLFTLENKYNVHWWRDWCINPCHFSADGLLYDGYNTFQSQGIYYDFKGCKHKLGEKAEGTDKFGYIAFDRNIHVKGHTESYREIYIDAKTGNVITPDATIGSCYGYTVDKHNLMYNLLDGIRKDPDGRRHIINMWQEDDFKRLHGLKPCAYQTQWNVRHGKDGIDYLDMCLYQRSSDYLTAGCINQLQYTVFLYMVAHDLGYKPGKFTWFVGNIQIYDRHIEQAKEMLKRSSVECKPYIWINPDKRNFEDLTPNDIEIRDYPVDTIKKINPQLKFDLGI